MPASARRAPLLPDACPHQRPRLVFNCATAPRPASLPQRRLSAVTPQRRPGQQRPAQWRPPASNIFPMLPLLPRCRHPLRHGTLGQQHLLGALANRSTMVPLPASPPRRPFLQRPAQWRPQASSSLATTAPLPATNLIWRRRVLRFG